MTEADILASTYFDKCTISRKEKIKLPNGTTKIEDMVIYENIPCSVTSNTSGSMNKEEGIGQISYTFGLFVRPTINIKNGDVVDIINANKEEKRYLVVKEFWYPSHRRCVLEEVERV